MKKIIFVFLITISISSFSFSQRIKDIAYFANESSEQIIAYGLVVGLNGTGDSHRSTFTVQSVSSMLKRFGITVPQTDLRVRNVAAVMVTTTINSGLKQGAKFDVTVSSLGDATSLHGGTLLLTPLSSKDGAVLGFAQGAISVGGFDIRTPIGNRVARNHTLAGRIPRGGILEVSMTNPAVNNQTVSIYLREPDVTTAFNVSQAINTRFGNPISTAIDAAQVNVNVPADRQENLVMFLSELEAITVEIDNIAKVILNERTGTVITGANVRIQPVTISHGNLNITIRSFPIISQPGAFSGGTTQVINNQIPFAVQDSANTIAIQGASTVQEVAAALNSLRVSPREIIAIFQALKESGALIAELVIM